MAPLTKTTEMCYNNDCNVSELKKRVASHVKYRTKYLKLYHTNTKGVQQEVCGETNVNDIITQNNTILEKVSEWRLNWFEVEITAKDPKFAKNKDKKDCNELCCFCMRGVRELGKKCPKGFEQ